MAPSEQTLFMYSIAPSKEQPVDRTPDFFESKYGHQMDVYASLRAESHDRQLSNDAKLESGRCVKFHLVTMFCFEKNPGFITISRSSGDVDRTVSGKSALVTDFLFLRRHYLFIIDPF